jgi:CarD family transcriptional regulator
MSFQVGDTVVHWTHGLGSVIGIDEIQLDGITRQYFVVEIELLKLWVPFEAADQGSIRLPADRARFEALFGILQAPGEALPDNPYLRKNTLRDRMQKRTPEQLCHVIRDLTDRAYQRPLNPDDSSLLLRARKHLLDEWVLSLGIQREIATSKLDDFLHAGVSDPKTLPTIVQ